MFYKGQVMNNISAVVNIYKLFNIITAYKNLGIL